MRLSDRLHQEFIQAFQLSFKKGELILFGSRVDDTKRGGDYDLAVVCEMSKEEFRKAKRKFFKYLLLNDIDLPIDLVHVDGENPLLAQEVKKGVRL